MKTCPVCEHSTYALYDKEIDITHHVCKACGYTFKDPADHVGETKEKALYSNHQNTMENQGYVNMFKRFLDFALDEDTRGPALDFGSGPGPVLYELLKREGFESYHYDPYFHDEKRVFTRRYGLITSTEVFEHLSDPKQIITQLDDLLKTEGILAVMTSLRPVSDEAFLKWWYRRDRTHIGFFTEESFKRLAEGTNLELTKTNRNNYFLFEKRSDKS